MATLLLLIIYVTFIGLGLPDSILGSAWPAMYGDIGASIGQANFVSLVTSICTVVMSYQSARIINKFGTGLVTTVSTALTAVGLIGCALSHSLWFTVLCSIPLGIGAGAIDSGLNNYVAVHYKAKHMNFLHSFYGIGVLLSPLLLSLVLDNENGWRQGYFLVFGVQVLITIGSIIALPLWKKVKKNEPEKENFTPRTLTIKEMAKNSTIRTLWVIFFATCALEFTCGVWGASYFVKAVGVSESLAALFVTLYYVGMSLSRFISGVVSSKVQERHIIFTGSIIIGVAIVLIALPLPPIVKAIGLMMVGLGNGPTFPNLTCLTPKVFGKEVSQSIISTQMVACYVGICLVPPLFGVFADCVSISGFPYFLLFSYLIMVIFLIVYDRKTAKSRKA